MSEQVFAHVAAEEYNGEVQNDPARMAPPGSWPNLMRRSDVSEYTPSRSMEYTWYIASEEWKHRAAVTKAERGNACERCGANAHLEVHHLTYKHIGAERPDELIVLCRKCHAAIHGRVQRTRGHDAPCGIGGILGDITKRLAQ